eukprot:TRINITY_DN5186_c0_g1_i2.p1 TRINITY_DN5186_c0_g1~~TRINITY_DN5186_c0_g1_i2.p1  ORF type:complete len:946 (+),score=173.90 TRINITY_DN5186_c0_g1_i2:114-2951(+)
MSAFFTYPKENPGDSRRSPPSVFRAEQRALENLGGAGGGPNASLRERRASGKVPDRPGFMTPPMANGLFGGGARPAMHDPRGQPGAQPPAQPGARDGYPNVPRIAAPGAQQALAARSARQTLPAGHRQQVQPAPAPPLQAHVPVQNLKSSASTSGVGALHSARRTALSPVRSDLPVAASMVSAPVVEVARARSPRAAVGFISPGLRLASADTQGAAAGRPQWAFGHTADSVGVQRAVTTVVAAPTAVTNAMRLDSFGTNRVRSPLRSPMVPRTLVSGAKSPWLPGHAAAQSFRPHSPTASTTRSGGARRVETSPPPQARLRSPSPVPVLPAQPNDAPAPVVTPWPFMGTPVATPAGSMAVPPPGTPLAFSAAGSLAVPPGAVLTASVAGSASLPPGNLAILPGGSTAGSLSGSLVVPAGQVRAASPQPQATPTTQQAFRAAASTQRATSNPPLRTQLYAAAVQLSRPRSRSPSAPDPSKGRRTSAGDMSAAFTPAASPGRRYPVPAAMTRASSPPGMAAAAVVYCPAKSSSSSSSSTTMVKALPSSVRAGPTGDRRVLESVSRQRTEEAVSPGRRDAGAALQLPDPVNAFFPAVDSGAPLLDAGEPSSRKASSSNASSPSSRLKILEAGIRGPPATVSRLAEPPKAAVGADAPPEALSQTLEGLQVDLRTEALWWQSFAQKVDAPVGEESPKHRRQPAVSAQVRQRRPGGISSATALPPHTGSPEDASPSMGSSQAESASTRLSTSPTLSVGSGGPRGAVLQRPEMYIGASPATSSTTRPSALTPDPTPERKVAGGEATMTVPAGLPATLKGLSVEGGLSRPFAALPAGCPPTTASVAAAIASAAIEKLSEPLSSAALLSKPVALPQSLPQSLCPDDRLPKQVAPQDAAADNASYGQQLLSNRAAPAADDTYSLRRPFEEFRMRPLDIGARISGLPRTAGKTEEL